ncbi:MULTISPECIES: DUF6124 family protein [unclassified Pseudomonas]|uniref:DUF6124 family protein n=1 Tax=unclassified Pseudomonas TaxID=196821 RepID=UPI000C86DF9F|nr:MULTISPECIES: DUF6124 family protein [unclassified Pseudomonas]NWB21876.1 hypothetical protein [Pseudomonas sp. D4002]PMU26410.1 hypothetical protein C1X90_06620 [Pseudomonas sp. GP01-A9]PMU31525.1 hypothetical protein C1X88_05065 [Pseudomonas sp. GP01-A13]PMU43648.1 hypothetical protein C1X89_06235 [Pseudomonas sp. GP01-A8]PMU55557.1 hypothetical protein C1X87_03555 [Pseudomonas sp. GP01-A14]
MKKITPNPPCSNHPGADIFCIAQGIDPETLLVQACETLASLNALTTDLAFELDGAFRHKLLATQQLSVLGELLVTRALDILVPTADSKTQERTASEY